MKSLFVFISTLLFASFCFANEIPPAQLEDQENDQQTCIQERVNQCMSKCNNVEDNINCEQACTENARNECRYAGE